MDNFNIDITAEKPEQLKLAIELAMSRVWGTKKIASYKVVRLKEEINYYTSEVNPKSQYALNCKQLPNYHIYHYKNPVYGNEGILTLLLADCLREDYTALLFPLQGDDIINFVHGWLKNNSDPGPEPDHDGDNKSGWRIFIPQGSAATFGIQGVWAMYGK